MVLAMLNMTAFYFLTSPIANPWIVIHFFQQVSFAIIISCNIAADAFPFIGAFLGAYQCFKILKKKNRNYFTFSELMLLYLRKYLRIAPAYYFVLFLGWNSCQRLADSPVWPYVDALWYNCDSNWWAKMLLIGNLYGY